MPVIGADVLAARLMREREPWWAVALLWIVVSAVASLGILLWILE